MKVNPRSSICRIVSRLGSLCKSGHDTEWHLLGVVCVTAIKDSLIDSKTDTLTHGIQKNGSQIDVGVFQQSVAYLEVCAHLVAVNLYIVECEVHLVQDFAALGPDCFVDGALNYLTSVTGNGLHVYVSV